MVAGLFNREIAETFVSVGQYDQMVQLSDLWQAQCEKNELKPLIGRMSWASCS